jgi:hypothetical protein
MARADYFMQFPFSMRMSDFSMDKLKGFNHKEPINKMIEWHHPPTLRAWQSILFVRPETPIKMAEPILIRKINKTYQDVGTLVKTTLVDYEVEPIANYFAKLEFPHTNSTTPIRRKE